MTSELVETTLEPTACALCGTFDNADELYPSTFDESALRPSVWSARRVPDRTHFRFVRCRTCGLVRSDPVVDPGLLAALYREATFDYAAETDALRATYGRYLERVVAYGANRGSYLDVGCGNGFMLEEALRQGFERVRGVEPTEAAVAAASPAVAGEIVVSLLTPGLFEPESFDVVTLFQTLDHLPRPGEVTDEIVALLRPGGFLLCLNHDVRAVSARVLGEHSPIFDIEHTYLYDRATLRQLLEQHGLTVVAEGQVLNRYSLRYVAQLLPLPAGAKRGLLGQLERSRAGRLPVILPLGNLWAAARKP